MFPVWCSTQAYQHWDDSNHVQRHMFTTWLPLHSCLAGDYLVMSAWPFQSCCCGERCGTNGANGEPVAVPSVRANDGPQETRNEDEWSRPWRREIQFSTCELWINSNIETSSKICQWTALYSVGAWDQFGVTQRVIATHHPKSRNGSCSKCPRCEGGKSVRMTKSWIAFKGLKRQPKETR